MKVEKTDEEWRAQLTPEQFHVMREHGTERPWTVPLNFEKRDGVYSCAACGAELFGSDAKYESNSGWPSFFKPLAEDAVGTEEDAAFGMRRTEVHCARCGSHLGHVFPDGPRPTGLRYCINSVCLTLTPKEDA